MRQRLPQFLNVSSILFRPTNSLHHWIVNTFHLFCGCSRIIRCHFIAVFAQRTQTSTHVQLGKHYSFNAESSDEKSTWNWLTHWLFICFWLDFHLATGINNIEFAIQIRLTRWLPHWKSENSIFVPAVLDWYRALFKQRKVSSGQKWKFKQKCCQKYAWKYVFRSLAVMIRRYWQLCMLCVCLFCRGPRNSSVFDA